MQKEYDLSLTVGTARTPLLLGELLSVETLLRLNPHWIIEGVEVGGDSFTACLKDYVTDEAFSLAGTLIVTQTGQLVLTMDHDTYQVVNISITDEKLIATVTYGRDEEDLSEELERYVVLWLRSVKEYLRMYLKDSLYTRGSRYIMNKIILQMTPSQRKISLMLIRFTVVEIVVILLIVVGYFVFVLK